MIPRLFPSRLPVPVSSSVSLSRSLSLASRLAGLASSTANPTPLSSLSNTRFSSLSSTLRPSFLPLGVRSVHNPAQIRGVGPRPRKPNRLTASQRAKRQASLAEYLGQFEPINGPVYYVEPKLELPLKSFSTGVPLGSVSVSSELFNAPMRKDIIQRVVRWQRAKARQGTHKMKTRAEVSGTGRKPYPQKGTGRARRSTMRGPLHRGGGVAHPPVPRSHEFDLPKRVRLFGLRVALTAKYQERNVFLIDSPALPDHKSRSLVSAMERLNIDNFLIVHADGELDSNLALAARNVPHCHFLPSRGLNVVSILRHPTLIFSQAALKEFEERIKYFKTKRGPKFMIGSSGGGVDFMEFKQAAGQSAKA